MGLELVYHWWIRKKLPEKVFYIKLDLSDRLLILRKEFGYFIIYDASPRYKIGRNPPNVGH